MFQAYVSKLNTTRFTENGIGEVFRIFGWWFARGELIFQNFSTCTDIIFFKFLLSDEFRRFWLIFIFVFLIFFAFLALCPFLKMVLSNIDFSGPIWPDPKSNWPRLIWHQTDLTQSRPDPKLTWPKFYLAQNFSYIKDFKIFGFWPLDRFQKFFGSNLQYQTRQTFSLIFLLELILQVLMGSCYVSLTLRFPWF